MNLVLVRAGIRTADVLLAQFYGLAPLEKAGPDPLTPRGFDRVVLGVLRELRAGVAGKEKKAIEALLRELEGKDWAKLGEAARDKAFRDAAEKYLGFGPDVGAAVGQVARHVGPTIITGTKVAAIHRDRLRIEPSLNAVDERMVVAAATHQALFARDEHGRRSTYLSDRARAVVSQGLEEGLDRYEIAKRIRSDLGAAADVRSENYWRLIASVFTGRARTYGHLSAMSESGIEEFEFEAVLDEVTTDICRFMHRKVFSTGAGLARFSQVESASNPEEVKDLQPWASTGKAEDGSKAIFYKAGGARSMIARVDESAVGRKDEVGLYSAGMKRGALEKAGLTTPPLHGHCRSTALPVLGAVQVLPGGPGQEALGAPLAPEKAPMPPKPVKVPTLQKPPVPSPFAALVEREGLKDERRGPSGVNAVYVAEVDGQKVYVKPAATRGVNGAVVTFDPRDAVVVHGAFRHSAEAIGLGDSVEPAMLLRRPGQPDKFVTRGAPKKRTSVLTRVSDGDDTAVEEIDENVRVSAALLDYLHRNSDRHEANVLVDGDGKITLIDHDRTLDHGPPKADLRARSVFFPGGTVGFFGSQRELKDLPKKAQKYVKHLSASTKEAISTELGIPLAEAAAMKARASRVVSSGLHDALVQDKARSISIADGEPEVRTIAPLGEEDDDEQDI